VLEDGEQEKNHGEREGEGHGVRLSSRVGAERIRADPAPRLVAIS
jgi:hypothetical protein